MELRLKEEYNYKDDIPKENYNLQRHLAFYQQGSYKRMMVMSIVLPTQL